MQAVLSLIYFTIIFFYKQQLKKIKFDFLNTP